MGINLKSLCEAADRYQQDLEAKDSVDPGVLIADAREKSQRHRELFASPLEKFAKSRAMALRAGVVPLTDGAELPPALAALDPEATFRDNDLRPVRFLQLATLVSRSVGRIRIPDGPITAEGDATGFMVAPGLLMTNWHVLKGPDYAEGAYVVFDDEETLMGEPKEIRNFRLRPDLLFVNDKELDYAIVQVDLRTASGVSLAQYGYLRLFKQTGKIDPTQREVANIIQHPGGGSKKIAFRDNYIASQVPDGADPARQLNSLFYGSDTLKGSSGAPVCSDQWYVIALHRGGVPKTKVIDGERVVVRRDGTPAMENDSSSQIDYLTNEGTRISRIYHSLEESAPAEPDAAEALQRLLEVSTDPRSGPIDLRTAPLMLPALPSAESGGVDEITSRSLEKFDGATGYSPGFLGRGRRIGLPGETAEVKRELATLKDSTATELKYDHYSLKVSKERRTPFYAAGNIDGSKLRGVQGLGSLPPRPAWSYDPRMDKAWQPDDSIFSNAMQRGHLFKREDANWGEDLDAIKRADMHSFTIPNATPMIANFNNVEWGDLEDIVTKECQAGKKVSYFAGPIFRSSDPFFNELKSGVSASERRKGMRVPQSFWKIVAWVEEGDLKSAGFILDQTDEITARGLIEEMNFGTYRKRPISDIERATGLKFPELLDVDTYNLG